LIEIENEAIEILPEMFTTGSLGTTIPPEQSLIIGDIVITGCAHPGVVKIAKKAREILKGRSEEISLIFGGFHLLDKSKREIIDIIENLKEIGVKKAIPCHCSGDLAMGLFQKEFNTEEKEERIYAGKEFKI
jgi:7,8-dihydropterin-6-yl-methyl-4-(beta-D-ribofuranosyl)aminobenzene 5'-phosphate synthase